MQQRTRYPLCAFESDPRAAAEIGQCASRQAIPHDEILECRTRQYIVKASACLGIVLHQNASGFAPWIAPTGLELMEDLLARDANGLATSDSRTTTPLAAQLSCRRATLCTSSRSARCGRRCPSTSVFR